MPGIEDDCRIGGYAGDSLVEMPRSLAHATLNGRQAGRAASRHATASQQRVAGAPMMKRKRQRIVISSRRRAAAEICWRVAVVIEMACVMKMPWPPYMLVAAVEESMQRARLRDGHAHILFLPMS